MSQLIPEILYEDGHLVAINKPAGLVVHADGRTEESTLVDWVSVHYPELKNIGAPGKHFTYCNTNYALLALLAEKITNTPFPVFIQQEFFKPLGMTHSFIFTKEDSARINPSYDWRG